MQQIITRLLELILWQNQIIQTLCVLLFGKNFKPKSEKPVDKPYRKLSVDPLPIFDAPTNRKIYDWQTLVAERGVKPIKRRGGHLPPEDLTCPYCGAPQDYLKSNDGGRGQYKCKVCKALFNREAPKRDAEPYCPFCAIKLALIKKRKTFDVYRCNNVDCGFRKRRLSAMNAAQKALYKASPHRFKLRYIYRAFRFDFTPLSKETPVLPKVDLPNITASPHVFGLILTYHINYGLPLRKTAALMFDVHNVKVSHQTVANYCSSVAVRVKPFTDGFPYELSDKFCGDETYIKVQGKWRYIFFFFDAAKKIILSYRVQKNRDYQSAILAINDVLTKLKTIPEKLNLIADGNPIYLLAQQWFAQRGVNFDVAQVVGLTNDDPVSAEFRPLKQIIERLNRTFKGNYKPTGGFSADFGAIASVTLFVAYFNFLRPHSSLENRVPALIPALDALPNMPAKWLKLIAMSEDFIKAQSIK